MVHVKMMLGAAQSGLTTDCNINPSGVSVLNDSWSY